MNDDFAVTVLSPPGGHWAQVCLAGSIDEAAAARLAAVTDLLAGTNVAWTFVDVADVTFADTTLLGFCVRLGAVLPPESALQVCRPGPMTRQLLEDVASRRIVALRDNLPLLDTSGAMPSAGWVRRRNRSRLQA